MHKKSTSLKIKKYIRGIEKRSKDGHESKSSSDKTAADTAVIDTSDSECEIEYPDGRIARVKVSGTPFARGGADEAFECKEEKTVVILKPRHDHVPNLEQASKKHNYVLNSGGIEPLLTRYTDKTIKNTATLHYAALVEGPGGDSRNTYRIAMERAAGIPYSQLSIESIEKGLKIYLSAIEAIRKKHQQNKIAVDLNNGNLFYDEDSNTTTLIDGGWSCAEGEELPSNIRNATRTYIQKHYHIAPEAWDGGLASKAHDVYSLGLLMFYLLKPLEDLAPKPEDFLKLLRGPASRQPEKRPNLDTLAQDIELYLVGLRKPDEVECKVQTENTFSETPKNPYLFFDKPLEDPSLTPNMPDMQPLVIQ